jgi:hypothetical protein
LTTRLAWVSVVIDNAVEGMAMFFSPMPKKPPKIRPPLSNRRSLMLPTVSPASLETVWPMNWLASHWPTGWRVMNWSLADFAKPDAEPAGSASANGTAIERLSLVASFS